MTNDNSRGASATLSVPEGLKLPDVILLNGTSSAGKSSLTLALQARLPFVRMGIDDFVWERAPIGWYGAPEGFIHAPGNVTTYGAEGLKLWRAYHRSVRVCVDEGLGVVVDDAILTRELLDDWVTALDGLDVFFVGVHCAPDELTLREIARRDRTPGSAVGWIERIHAHATYDMEIDTTTTPSSALAAQIIAGLQVRSGRSAFERMRSHMLTPAERDGGLGRYAAPQTLVNISPRRRLNLLVAGEGKPTVIFAPGGWASTLEWARVQHAIAARTRTVAYDNAGFGFSDPGPAPRTASAIVNDLRAALKATGVGPPYVLAGWSFGGLVMRLFAFLHPQEVVGMVMVDSASEHQIRWYAQDPSAWARDHRRKLLRAERMARAGALAAGAPEYDEFVVRDGAPELPPAVKAARRAQRTSPGFYRAARSESANMTTVTLDEMDAARTPLGDMPLIVLTAAEFFPIAPGSARPAEAWREAWRAGHDEIVALSTRGERRTIEAGHAIQWERPDAVIAAIEAVLALAR
jgi:chloramphenicol 3-O-phosphotransferase/pimeloyl-ACP methyl ester carboxylesterase